MESLLTVILALMCTTVPLWIGTRYGVVPLMSPMHLLAYFCAFGFFIKVAVYSGNPDLAFYRIYIDTADAMPRGALYLATFILLMCVGYRLAVRPSDPASGVIAARSIAGHLVRQRWLFAMAFGVAGLTFALILQARGVSLFTANLLSALNQDKQIHVNDQGVGATLAGIKMLFIVPKCAFVMLLAQGVVCRAPWILLQAALLALLLVAIALVSGDRFELVELLVFASATYLIVGRAIGPMALICMGAGALGVLSMASYMTALRGIDASLLAQMVRSTYFLDINAAVMVTDQVRPATYLLGESYGWWTFGWVPRAVWLDKPAIDLGVFFKRDVMGVTTGGAFNVTGPGEAFMNFGWAGAFVGFVLGWIYRRAEVFVLRPSNSLRFGTFYLYPLLVYPFVQASLHSSFSAFIVAAAVQLVLIAVMIAFFVPRLRIHLTRRQLAMEVHYV